MKNKTKFELILLFNLGYKPCEIIKKFNYPKSTVYKYSRYYKDACQKIKEILQ